MNNWPHFADSKAAMCLYATVASLSLHLADIISGVIEAYQLSSLISLRPHGNSSRQNAGIVYLRKGGKGLC